MGLNIKSGFLTKVVSSNHVIYTKGRRPIVRGQRVGSTPAVYTAIITRGHQIGPKRKLRSLFSQHCFFLIPDLVRPYISPYAGNGDLGVLTTRETSLWFPLGDARSTRPG